MADKRINVQSNGNTSPYRTSANTVGELFADRGFREDFNISDRAQPMVNDQNVDGDRRLNEGDTVSYFVGPSSKS
jgi:hypothetical protein